MPGSSLPMKASNSMPALLLVFVLGLLIGGALGLRGQLRFKEDGTFKIVQLTDLHYGEDAALDSQSDEVQATVLHSEQPSLTVFSGDMVSGFAWDKSTQGWYAERWRQLIGPVNAAGSPYASILGNHDSEADLSRRQIVELDAGSSALSFTRPGPLSLTGAGNYYLDIYDAAGEEVRARVWMLDSMSRGCGPVPVGWGCVAKDVVGWVRSTAAGLPRVPSLAFIHIPIPQFMGVWNERPTSGRKEEGVSCPLIDTGVFAAFRELGITAIYSGHDHNNDYIGEMEGVRLAYGRKSGYGCYGPPEGWLRGARVIELRQGEDPAHSQTWIRQEDGSRAEQAPTPEAAKAGTRQYTCTGDEFESGILIGSNPAAATA